MKKILLSFFMFLLMFGFQTSFAQEEGEDQGQSIYNSGAVSNPQSIFEDSQPIAGSDWEWMHPTPSGSTLNWVQVIDATTWYAVGAAGTFQKTTDGGTTWTVVKTLGGLSSTGFYRTLYDGHFFDANTGLVCGSSGTLLRTTDAGATWDSVGVGVSASIYDIFFLILDPKFSPAEIYFCACHFCFIDTPVPDRDIKGKCNAAVSGPALKVFPARIEQIAGTGAER